MFEAVEGMLDEHEQLEAQLGAPETHADARLAKRLNQRYAELSRIIGVWQELKQYDDDIAAARELGAEDEAFAAEAETLATRRAEAEELLRRLLVPRDPADDKDALLEVKSGEGGEESALFAGDLLRMYSRYAERRGWTVELIDANESDLGGYKSVTVAVKSKGTVEPGHGPYGLLKFEGGVHRVQRVPITESQGRVHTSAAGVLVLPEAEPVDVTDQRQRPAHRRLPQQRPRRPERQHHRLRGPDHPPADRHRGRLPEREEPAAEQGAAMRILRARLLAAAQETADAEASDARRSQVRTVDRSERIRTYNYAENRISDHRTGYKAYNLDQVLDGDLQPVLDTSLNADLEARLAGLED